MFRKARHGRTVRSAEKSHSKKTNTKRCNVPYLKEALDLRKEYEEQIQQRKEMEKDQSMDYNIQHISNTGDFSTRNKDSSKSGDRRGKCIPLKAEQ